MRIIKYFIICLFFSLIIKSAICQTANDSIKTNFRRTYFIAGLGFPEFIHAGIGYYINRKISIDISYGNLIFNNLLGIGSTYYFYKKSNNENFNRSFLINLAIKTNPDNNPLILQSGGETIGSVFEIYTGYNSCNKNGFIFRAQIGMLTTIEDNQINGGINTKLSFGYCF